MDMSKGLPIRTIDAFQSYTKHFAEGLIATSGIQYSAVVTFGTAVATVFEELVDPGFQMGLKELELSFVQRFTERVGGTTTGSLLYHWQGREEWHDLGGATPTN